MSEDTKPPSSEQAKKGLSDKQLYALIALVGLGWLAWHLRVLIGIILFPLVFAVELFWR